MERKFVGSQDLAQIYESHLDWSLSEIEEFRDLTYFLDIITIAFVFGLWFYWNGMDSRREEVPSTQIKDEMSTPIKIKQNPSQFQSKLWSSSSQISHQHVQYSTLWCALTELLYANNKDRRIMFSSVDIIEFALRHSLFEPFCQFFHSLALIGKQLICLSLVSFSNEYFIDRTWISLPNSALSSSFNCCFIFSCCAVMNCISCVCCSANIMDVIYHKTFQHLCQHLNRFLRQCATMLALRLGGFYSLAFRNLFLRNGFLESLLFLISVLVQNELSNASPLKLGTSSQMSIYSFT